MTPPPPRSSPAAPHVPVESERGAWGAVGAPPVAEGLRAMLSPRGHPAALRHCQAFAAGEGDERAPGNYISLTACAGKAESSQVSSLLLINLCPTRSRLLCFPKTPRSHGLLPRQTLGHRCLRPLPARDALDVMSWVPQALHPQ